MSLDISAAINLVNSDIRNADLASAGNAKSSTELVDVARQFESIFIQMMLQSMRDASLASGILDNENSEFYYQMFDRQVASSLTETGGIGIAEIMLRQLQSQALTTAAQDEKENVLSGNVPAKHQDEPFPAPFDVNTEFLMPPLSATSFNNSGSLPRAKAPAYVEKSIQYYLRELY